MLKKSKIISGVCLIAQSFVCVIMALISFKKEKKGLSALLLALGGIGGATGLWILYDECKNVSESKLFDLDNVDYDDEDGDHELFNNDEDQEIHFSFADDDEDSGEENKTDEA